MLLNLTIKDLVLIETLHLEVKSGLSVLTGETGAGKSILLDALGLALGMRGDASLIRQGAEQASVCAEFSIKGNAHVISLLEEHSLCDEGATSVSSLVFRRIITRNATGRSRAFVNDQMVSAGLLRLLGDALLEIHGQFDRLLDSTSYRLLLDEFTKEPSLRQIVRQKFQEWQSADHQWRETEKQLADLRQNEDIMKTHLKELQKINPTMNEEENLRQEREGLSQVGKLSDAIRDSAHHLQTSSVESSLHAACKALQRVQGSGEKKVEAAVVALERALTEVIEANAQIQDIIQDLADHPRRLQQIDERLYVLRSAARKYGVVETSLVEFQEKIANQLASLDHATELLEIARKSALAARTAYHQVALELQTCRLKAAQSLEQSVMAELPSLKLPQAQFKVQFSELPETQWSESGIDRIDFMVAMNKGQDFCSLSKSASGGELARLMLALKVSLASRSSLPTIIFDEIDTGVGGAVAAAIGDRLAKLSENVQILAVTHSPQLAACAQNHYLVFKEDQGTSMRTSIVCLDEEERQDELARMLSGAEITLEARAAAQKLLGAR